MRIQLFVVAAAMTAATSVFGQSFNIDIGDPFSASGVPSDLYGAAAGQPGFWNAVGSGAFGFALMDLSGSATGVTLSNVGGAGDFEFDNPGTFGDDQALMDDLQDIGGVGGVSTWTLEGLVNGMYEVFTYSWAPDSDTFLTQVGVTGSPDPLQLVGGAWTGGHALGTTYAQHGVNVTNGMIEITASTFDGFGSVNGFQIVFIPAPGGLILLGIAGCLGARRRRRQVSQA